MVKVFAYGSNLCLERIRVRTPSARVVAIGTLAGHSLRWHKKSADGSGKCNAFATGLDSDLVWGVVYELTPGDKIVLDRFEGLGVDYFEKRVPVVSRDGLHVDAIAYVANPGRLDDAARPYHWYKGFVTMGARQHDFPAVYREALHAIEALHDPDIVRHAREAAVLDAALQGVALLRSPRVLR